MKHLSFLLCEGFKKNLAAPVSPEFSWQVKNCKRQRAYRVRVYSAENRSLVHDSGIISSPALRHALTCTLAPASEYICNLWVKTDCGEEEKSLFFRTELGAFDENAKWICSKNPKEAFLGGSPVTYFKKTFALSATPKKSAYAQIAGLGLFVLYVNGKRAHESVLTSPFTNYNKTVFYETYDIAPLLRAGENEIEVLLGDGWYSQSSYDTWKFWQADWKDCHKLLFEAQIEGVKLLSDESWLASQDGGIYRSCLRLGEYHDNRKTTVYSANAVVAATPKGTLKPDPMHPILECERLAYKTCKPDGKGGYLLDFGRNIAGYAHVNTIGKDGQEIKLTYGDALKDGEIDNVSNSQYVRNDELRPTFQIDKCTLREGANEFKPLFVYHGFQYIKAEGFDHPPKAEEITAVFIHTSFEKTGKVQASSSRINTLQKMTADATCANFVGIPTDCPHREKNGWTGDLQLSVMQMLYNYNCDIDLAKFLADVRDCQLESGIIPCIAPVMCNTDAVTGYHWGNGPAWDIAIFEITSQLLQKRNNRRLIEKHLPFLEKYYAYIETQHLDDGLYECGLGDWNYPKKTELEIAPLKLIASLCVLQMSENLRDFCKLVYGEDKGYGDKALALRKAIKKSFIKKDGRVAKGGVTAYAGILYYNLVRGDWKKRVFERLLAQLETDKYTMKFGIIGSKWVHAVLCENGRTDLSVKILKGNDYPSFGKWIEWGAVTMWEDFEATNSRNHYMYGACTYVFYEYYAGISVRFENGVQINRVTLDGDKSVGNISAKTQTPNGLLAIKRSYKHGRKHVKIVLPPNSKNEIVLPDGSLLRKNGGTYEFDF